MFQLSDDLLDCTYFFERSSNDFIVFSSYIRQKELIKTNWNKCFRYSQKYLLFLKLNSTDHINCLKHTYMFITKLTLLNSIFEMRY